MSVELNGFSLAQFIQSVGFSRFQVWKWTNVFRGAMIIFKHPERKNIIISLIYINRMAHKNQAELFTLTYKMKQYEYGNLIHVWLLNQRTNRMRIRMIFKFVSKLEFLYSKVESIVCFRLINIGKQNQVNSYWKLSSWA